MYQRIAHITLVVEDYDEAIDFYTKKLYITILEDTKIDDKVGDDCATWSKGMLSITCQSCQ